MALISFKKSVPPASVPASGGPEEAAPAVDEAYLQALPLSKSALSPHDLLCRLRPRQLQEDSWFHAILRRGTAKLVQKRERHGALERWRETYTDLDEEQLSARIIRTASRRTAAIGALAGGAMTITELSLFGNLGWWAIPTTFLLACLELALVERIQLGLIFTLATQHRVPFNHENMHEVGALYAHVLNIKGASRAAAWARSGTLALTRVIALRFVRLAAVKFALPVVSIGIGGMMNLVMTRTLGGHTLKKFRSSERVHDHLQNLLRYDPKACALIFGLMVRMAAIDDEIDARERDLLRRVLEELGLLSFWQPVGPEGFPVGALSEAPEEDPQAQALPPTEAGLDGAQPAGAAPTGAEATGAEAKESAWLAVHPELVEPSPEAAACVEAIEDNPMTVALEELLGRTEQSLFEELRAYRDADFSALTMESLMLMAIIDGPLNADEQALIERASEALETPFDLSFLHSRFMQIVSGPKLRWPLLRARGKNGNGAKGNGAKGNGAKGNGAKGAPPAQP